MKPGLRRFCDELENKIKDSYINSVTMAQAESLAGELLIAMTTISAALRDSDLDARMRKSGVKALRGNKYGEIVAASEKKPTVDEMDHMLNTDSMLIEAQNELDTAEVDTKELDRYYDICREAHIHYRGIAKANFG